MIEFRGASIKNYRGIRDLEFQLPECDGIKLYPLIGLNESGKTTILEAITLVRHCLQDLTPLNIPGKKGTPLHELIPVKHRLDFSQEIAVSLKFKMSEVDKELIETEFQELTGYRLRVLSNDLALSTTVAFKNGQPDGTPKHGLTFDHLCEKVKRNVKKLNDSELWKKLTSIVMPKLPRILYVPNFLFDIPNSIELSEESQLARKGDSVYHSLLDGLLKLDNPNASFHDILIKNSKSTAAVDIQRKQSLIGRLEYAINENIINNWHDLGGKALKDLKISLSLQTADNKSYLSFSIRQKGNTYNFADRSLGFRWYFSFSLINFYSSSLEANRQTVYLLDEPANNLHAGAQSRLIERIQTSQNSCYIYSTHSHSMLRPELLPSTYVVINKGVPEEDSTEYSSHDSDITMVPFRQFASTHPNQSQHFSVVLSLLDTPLNTFEPNFPCVFVEGKSDWYYLKLAKLSGIDFNMNIYPGGGVNTLDMLVHQALSREMKLAILVDSDTDIAAKLTRTYGILCEKRLLALGNIDPKLKNGESLFSTACKKDIIKAAGLTGSKKAVFQRACELLVAANRAITFDTVTEQNFTHLSVKLSEIANLSYSSDAD